MTGLELIAIASAAVAAPVVSPIVQYKQQIEQAEAIREQARVERGATEKNIGLRMARARRLAATARARAGASGVNPLVGSPLMSELGIIGMENQQAGILRQNAMTKQRLANEAASDMELGANIGLGVGLAGGLLTLGMMGNSAGIFSAGADTASTAGSLGSSTLAPAGNVTGGVEDLIQVMPQPQYNLGVTGA